MITTSGGVHRIKNKMPPQIPNHILYFRLRPFLSVSNQYVFFILIWNWVAFLLSGPCFHVFRVHVRHAQLSFDNNPFCMNVNMSENAWIIYFVDPKIEIHKMFQIIP